MNWLVSVLKVAGASFPVSASLVQLHSEIQGNAFEQRIRNLEDPISALHPRIQELARHVYSAIEAENSPRLQFSKEFYDEFSRPLAALESQGLIQGLHTFGDSFFAGLRITDPTFIMYMCSLFEDSSRMQGLVEDVDSCEKGTWLDGKDLQEKHALPIPVIAAVFRIYESKGYGLTSGEIGVTKYCGKA
jgi:tRNA A37 N6-isopentenylltransferase MiaA